MLPFLENTFRSLGFDRYASIICHFVFQALKKLREKASRFS